MSPVRLFKGKRETKEQDETDSLEMAVDINPQEDVITEQEDTTTDIEPGSPSVGEEQEAEEVEGDEGMGEGLPIDEGEPQDQELEPTLAEVEYDPVSEFLVEEQRSDPEEIRDDEDEPTFSTQIVNNISEEPEDMESDNLMSLPHDTMTTEMMSDFSESQSVDIKASEMILEFAQITDGLGGWTQDNA